MRRARGRILAAVTAVIFLVAAVLTAMQGNAATWQPITLFIASGLFAAVAIIAGRRQGSPS